MDKYISKFMNNLNLRWKMLVVVIPLVVLPIIIVGGVIGYISVQQAYLGNTKASKDDLDHMTEFAIDLLDVHYKQFQVYKEDKKKTIKGEMKTLTDLAYTHVESQYRLYKRGQLASAEEAKLEAAKALKKVSIGQSGYIYAMDSKGLLLAHIAREGDNIYNEKDEEGNYFIRSMCKAALNSKPGEVLYTVYPWRNSVIGDTLPRKKIVAYRYFREWDWIIATGEYLEEAYEDIEFEKRSFEELKRKIKNKLVGQTGYIFCLDDRGVFTIHPENEGENILNAKDADGHLFIKEMLEKKNGWIRYQWKNIGSEKPRMKIVRYGQFKPWNWIVAVGSYEDEFYREADLIKGQILSSMAVMIVSIGFISVFMVCLAAQFFTEPINKMIRVIRETKAGRFDERMDDTSSDELGELASHFNRMTEIFGQHREIESNLAQQAKMASLGLLSSGVAHEINNPLGVILGYAAFLEGKIDKDDPLYIGIHEIKRESKRCKKIVQDLLNFARIPKPVFECTEINELLDRILDFAANHTDMHNVVIKKDFSLGLPPIWVDRDQLQQVAINLILNAGAAMPNGGEITVRAVLKSPEWVSLIFEDNGPGIESEHLDKIFEPFFTTKRSGTGLGLAISRQIISQHHGVISVASEIDRGTTVTVILPLNQEIYYHAG